MKTKARKYATTLKKQAAKTGGGTKSIESDPVLDAVLSIIHEATVRGFNNKYDNDAESSTVGEIIDDDDDGSENDVFNYLMSNRQVPDWKKNNPSNLKSKISAPFEINKDKNTPAKPYDNVPQQKQMMSLKEKLAVLLKEQAIEKHNYKIELLKLQIQKEHFLIRKIQKEAYLPHLMMMTYDDNE